MKFSGSLRHPLLRCFRPYQHKFLTYTCPHHHLPLELLLGVDLVPATKLAYSSCSHDLSCIHGLISGTDIRHVPEPFLLSHLWIDTNKGKPGTWMKGHSPGWVLLHQRIGITSWVYGPGTKRDVEHLHLSYICIQERHCVAVKIYSMFRWYSAAVSTTSGTTAGSSGKCSLSWPILRGLSSSTT